MSERPLPIRVFISSPGDVADERALTRRLLQVELPSDPFLRGRVAFEVVSWDNPAAPIPMDAAITPQEAVNRFGPKPSECDVVVVVLWSRMGTHLALDAFRKPDGGGPYLSGTEWEFEDAVSAPAVRRPTTLVYRRMEKPRVELDDPDLAEKRHQYELVEQFFGRFKNPDGSFRGGSTPYNTSTDFEEILGKHLRHLLRERLAREAPGGDAAPVVVAAAPAWTGPPYPGLRPFTSDEAAIFFGRGREVDALVARLRDPAQRFLAVVGASGVGKSSLVRAGLLPRLADGAIEGSQHWRMLGFTPGAMGNDPFLALAAKLDNKLPAHAQKPPVKIAETLAQAPQHLQEYADVLLAERPPGAVLVLFVDQFEELLTAAAEKHRGAFAELLALAAGDPRLRVLATLRADFLPQGMADPVLAPLLQAGTFPLGPPGPAALTDMIRRPAERAGLDLDEGLADAILREAGGDPGEALPLVAFCLEELYRQHGAERRLTLDAYHAMSGLQGAIGRRAGELLEEIRKAEGTDLDAAVLPQLFRALVHVDAAGKAARRRASWDALRAAPTPVPRLVETLIGGRLLLAEETGGQATVMLAHEALLQEWPALHGWLERDRGLMQSVQRHLLGLAAADPLDRQHAATALARIGPAAAEAVPALAAALNDAHSDVRTAAAVALARIGPAAAEAVPALAAVLGDADTGVRRAAVAALGRIGPLAAETLAAALLGDGPADLRLGVAEVLGRIIGPAAAGTLADALGDADWEIRRAVVAALRRIGPAAAEASPKVVPALADALGDSDTGVRRAAADVLARIGPAAAEAVPALAAALGDADTGVREAAVAALEKIGPAAPEVEPALEAALRNPHRNVREGAARALERIRSASPQ